MCPAVVFGIVTGDTLDSYWPIFCLAPATVPEFFAKHNLPQCLGDFHSKYDSIYHVLPDGPCVCFQPAVLL